jgi:hypothetical protein
VRRYCLRNYNSRQHQQQVFCICTPFTRLRTCDLMNRGLAAALAIGRGLPSPAVIASQPRFPPISATVLLLAATRVPLLKAVEKEEVKAVATGAHVHRQRAASHRICSLGPSLVLRGLVADDIGLAGARVAWTNSVCRRCDLTTGLVSCKSWTMHLP